MQKRHDLYLQVKRVNTRWVTSPLSFLYRSSIWGFLLPKRACLRYNRNRALTCQALQS